MMWFTNYNNLYEAQTDVRFIFNTLFLLAFVLFCNISIKAFLSTQILVLMFAVFANVIRLMQMMS